MTLRVIPVRFEDACGFVEMWHRHHLPPKGHKFSLGVADEANVLRGVAIVGRPVARFLQDGMTLEATRTATDGTRNANSALYGAAWRATRALGFGRLITYIHTRHLGPTCADARCLHSSCLSVRRSESGASLRAAGWHVIAERPARRGWDCPSRPRRPNGAEGIPRTLLEARAPAWTA
ncbi:XF1762 family protein [Spirillospora sp. CA-108201]